MQYMSYGTQVLTLIPPSHTLAVYKKDNNYEKGQNR